MITSLLLALAMPAAQSAPVPPLSTVAPADAARRAKALQLAKLLNTEASLIDESGDVYVKTTKQVLLARGKLNDLESRYPGVVEAMLRASVPTVNRQMRERLPLLWDRVADAYAAIYTTVDLGQLISFYGSPTGRRMIASLEARLKPKAMMGDMTRNEDMSISAKSLQTDIRSTVPGVVADLSPADKAALIAFSRTAAYQKLRGNSTKTHQIILDWMQESDPVGEEEIATVMRAAVEAFIKKKDAGT